MLKPCLIEDMLATVSNLDIGRDGVGMECDDDAQVSGGAPSSPSSGMTSSTPISQKVKVDKDAPSDDGVATSWRPFR